MIERKDLINILSDLVRINSINPWLIPDGAGEEEIVNFISNWLERLDVDFELIEVEKNRKNIIARLPGTGQGRSICLYAHTDTVGFSGWEDRALKPQVKGNRLYGLGAIDDKAHCALAMLVIKSFVENNIKLRGDFIAAFVVDEEGKSIGAAHLAEHICPDAMLVLDSPFGPTQILTTHQGFIWLDVIVQGKAAHSMDTDIGVDAIAHAAEFIVRLQELDRKSYATSTHPLNGKIICHCAKIQGGTDYATYPDQCRLGIHLGIQPGENAETRLNELEDIFNQVKETYPEFKACIEVAVNRPPFKAQGHEELLEILSAGIHKSYGEVPKSIGLNSWGDAALFQQAGIPTLMLGSNGDNLHIPDEWVDIPDLCKLEKIIEQTVNQFCS